MIHHMMNKSAFTLIEILLVVVIVSLIASLSIYFYSSSQTVNLEKYETIKSDLVTILKIYRTDSLITGKESCIYFTNNTIVITNDSMNGISEQVSESLIFTPKDYDGDFLNDKIIFYPDGESTPMEITFKMNDGTTVESTLVMSQFGKIYWKTNE